MPHFRKSLLLSRVMSIMALMLTLFENLITLFVGHIINLHHKQLGIKFQILTANIISLPFNKPVYVIMLCYKNLTCE